MNNDFLINSAQLNHALESENSSGGSGITRRTFIKRAGVASVATLVAWNATNLIASGATSNYDISYRNATCDAFALSKGSGASDYFESASFPLLVPDWLENTWIYFKLKAWYTPVNMDPHPTTAEIKYCGEAFGILEKEHFVCQTDKYIFKGVCNISDGQITPTNTFHSASPGDTFRGPQTKPPQDWEVAVAIGSFEITPNSGSAQTITGRAKLLACLSIRDEVTRHYNPWNSMVENKAIKFEFRSHRH